MLLFRNNKLIMKSTILNILQFCQLWTMQLTMEISKTDYVHELRARKSQLSGVLGRDIGLQFIFTPTNEDTLNKFTVIKYDEKSKNSFSIYTRDLTSTSSKDFSYDINIVKGTFNLVLKNAKKDDVQNISVTAFYGNVEETSTVEIVSIMENPIVPLFNTKYITSNESVTLSWVCSTYNPVKSIEIYHQTTNTNQEIFISNRTIDKNSVTISDTAYEVHHVDGFIYVYIYNVSSSYSFDFVLLLQYVSNIGENVTFETSVIHVNIEDTNDDSNTHGYITLKSLESTYMISNSIGHHQSNAQITSTVYNQSIETAHIIHSYSSTLSSQNFIKKSTSTFINQSSKVNFNVSLNNNFKLNTTKLLENVNGIVNRSSHLTKVKYVQSKNLNKDLLPQISTLYSFTDTTPPIISLFTNIVKFNVEVTATKYSEQTKAVSEYPGSFLYPIENNISSVTKTFQTSLDSSIERKLFGHVLTTKHYRSTKQAGKLTFSTNVLEKYREVISTNSRATINQEIQSTNIIKNKIKTSFQPINTLNQAIQIVSASSLQSNVKDLKHNIKTTFRRDESAAFDMQNSNRTIAMDQSSSVQSFAGSTTTSKYTKNIFTDLAKVNITISNVANISLTLENMLQDGLDENKITENDIETVINLVSSCLDVTASNKKVNNNLLGAANIIIKSTDKVSLNRNVKKTFRYQLKRIAIGSTVNNTNGFHYKGEEISLFSFVQRSSDEIALFVSDSNDIYKSLQQQPNHTISSIIINNGTFLKKINNTSNLSMYSYSFTNDRLFEGINSKQVIVSSILDFTLPNFKIENLDNNFSINFETDTLETGLECGYWSEEKEIWETSGCVTIIKQKQSSKKGFVECKCNHLTSFSVLLTVEGATESKILTYVSTAGSIISLCGLLFTLLNYAIFPELRKTVAANTICNMCFSIATVLLIFLLGLKQTKNKTVCCIIASFLQYFFLTSFFWMAFMSMTLYRDIVKPMEYRQRGRLFKIISMLIAWGIPIVLVGATYPLVKDQFEEEEKQLCVIEGELSLYVTVVPSACIILFNLVMFIPIFYSLQKHLTRISNYQNRSLLYQRFRDSIVCIILLGLTWVFGLLCIRDAKLTFEYIFAILNSLQGFFIFISQVVNNNDARKLWSELLTKYYKTSGRKIHVSNIQIKDMSLKKKSEAAKVS